MASQNSPSLDSLPVELHQMILAQMNSPDDLYAAIRASKRLSQAYSGHREQILVTVIQSCLDPEIMTWVQAVLRIPDYRNLKYVCNAPQLEAPGEPGIWNLSDWHAVCRRREVERLTEDSLTNHIDPLSEQLKSAEIESFPVLRLSRSDNAEQRAQFKRTVNGVTELYPKLRMLMRPRTSRLPPPSRELICFEQRKFLRREFKNRRHELILLSNSWGHLW